VGPGSVRTFQARVFGTNATDVQWSILEGASGGSLSGSTYTAPNHTGVFHVVATLVADPRFSDTATVNVVPSGFRWVDSMSLPRSGHTATLLPDGRVLIAGGDACSIFSIIEGEDSDPCPLEEAELFDPSSGAFASTDSMMAKRVAHTATLLPNGMVLIAGGGSAIAELYDWSSGTFTSTGSMDVARSGHTATLLSDGRVLIAGGEPIGSNPSAELYDYVSGTFSSTGGTPMSVARGFHTATRLSDGRVLIAGGMDPDGDAHSATELFDPTTESFAAAGIMNASRAFHTATLLGSGKVLLTGGLAPGSSDIRRDMEIYDPTTASFSSIGNMASRRYSHFAMLLPSGQVLVCGGDIFISLNHAGFIAELFDPSTQSLVQTGSMGFVTRLRPGVAALEDGRVLVTGGSREASAEIYE
jgi:hypothetical protein